MVRCNRKKVNEAYPVYRCCLLGYNLKDTIKTIRSCKEKNTLSRYKIVKYYNQFYKEIYSPEKYPAFQDCYRIYIELNNLVSI